MLTAFAASAGDIPGETASELTKLVELVVGKFPLWIAAGILLVLSFIAAKMARAIVENKMAERGIEEEHKEVQILGGRMTYAVILILGITISLKIAGIDLTAIIAAGAFGIGFALKDMIMNFLAGVMILVGRHFTIGDFIKVGDTFGRVVEIQSRVTIMQATDGTKVIVPNSQLFSNKVTSFTGNPLRRIEVETSVDYRSDLANALKVCMLAVRNTHGILLEPKPVVLVSEFGASEIVIKVRGWVESRSGWMKIKSQLLQNLMEAFNKYSIDFPYPITQLVYDKEMSHEEVMVTEDAAGEKMIEDDKTKTNVQITATPAGQTVATQTIASSSMAAMDPSVDGMPEVAAPVVPVAAPAATVTATAANEPLVPMVEKKPNL